MTITQARNGWYLATDANVKTFLRWEYQLGGWVGYFESLSIGLWRNLSPMQAARIAERFRLGVDNIDRLPGV